MSINVAIVEDKDETRDSLRLLINGTYGFRCVSTHPSAEHALENWRLKKTDVVLVDIVLPKMSGIDLVRALKAREPGLTFVMITFYEDVDKLFAALRAGAHGYLLKRTPPAPMLEAIKEAYAGGGPMSPTIARKVIQYFQNPGQPDADLGQLTVRELEILQELSQGFTYREIAEHVGISFETVKVHIKSVYAKLHVHTRTEALAKYHGQR